MDGIKEQLVSKKSTPADNAKKAAVVFGSVILALIVFSGTTTVFGSGFTLVALVVSCVIIYGGYYILTGLNAEYEYCFTNGDMDIDKILGKRKRKHLCSFSLKDVTKFCKLEESTQTDSSRTQIIVSGGDAPTYYAEFSDSKLGDCAIYFSPDEAMLEYILPAIPARAKKSV